MDNIYFRGKEFGTVPANQNNLQQDNIDIGGPDLSPMLKFSDLLQVFPNRDEFTSTRDTAKGSWFVQVINYVISVITVINLDDIGIDNGPARPAEYQQPGNSGTA